MSTSRSNGRMCLKREAIVTVLQSVMFLAIYLEYLVDIFDLEKHIMVGCLRRSPKRIYTVTQNKNELGRSFYGQAAYTIYR